MRLSRCCSWGNASAPSEPCILLQLARPKDAAAGQARHEQQQQQEAHPAEAMDVDAAGGHAADDGRLVGGDGDTLLLLQEVGANAAQPHPHPHCALALRGPFTQNSNPAP